MADLGSDEFRLGEQPTLDALWEGRVMTLAVDAFCKSGSHCVKFYLHISKKEQKARLEARLQDPPKRWKFRPDDFAERKHWED